MYVGYDIEQLKYDELTWAICTWLFKLFLDTYTTLDSLALIYPLCGFVDNLFCDSLLGLIGGKH